MNEGKKLDQTLSAAEAAEIIPLLPLYEGRELEREITPTLEKETAVILRKNNNSRRR